MNTLQKTTLSLLSFVALSLYESLGMATDSGDKSLNNVIGATDSYKVSCPTNTDHFDLALLDSTVAPVIITPSSTVSPPQLFNAHLNKGILKTDALKIMGNKSATLTLKGGNGVYTLTLDNIGTNLMIPTPQSYTIQYHCFNAAGKDTTPSSPSTGLKAGIDSAIKSLKNNATAKFTLSCAKNAQTGNTSSLSMKITNKTKVPATLPPPTQTTPPSVSPVVNNQPILSAQVSNAGFAINAIDITGDLLYGTKVSLKSGGGDYRITVDSTGTDPNFNNTKKYSFQYRCSDITDTEQPSSLSSIQDQ